MTNNFYLKCFCSVWLGLGKLGAVSALINTNITGDSLLHTLKVVKAKAVLFTDDTEKGTRFQKKQFFEHTVLSFFSCLALSEISPHLDPSVALFKLGEPSSSSSDLVRSYSLLSTDLLSTLPSSRPEVEDRPGFDDPLMYIFTSGTTGLPKAATIKNSR